MRDELPPVVLLGGRENTLACARRFVGDGITTVVIDHDRAPALRSRGVIGVGIGDSYDQDAASAWLLDHQHDYGGAVVIALSDEALQGIVRRFDELDAAFRLALFDPKLVTDMLNKRSTLELAAGAGIALPRQWVVTSSPDGAIELPDDLVFPILVKPVHGFEARTKHLKADSRDQLLEHLHAMRDLPSGVVLNEFVPGGDEELSSYYALRTRDGTTLLEFTKRVDRRNPPNKGGATFHELIDLPDTAEVGRRFFDHIGLIGLGNVEFKHDARTGELKIIECNYRMTAALSLMQDHGIDLAGAVYDQAIGRCVAPIDTSSATGLMWYPVRDLISHRMSGDGIVPWLRRPWLRASVPYWRWSDPSPSLGYWLDNARHSVRKHTRSLRRRIAGSRV